MFFSMDTIHELRNITDEAINITQEPANAEKDNTNSENDNTKTDEHKKYRLCKTYDHRLPIRVTSRERDILKSGAEERGLSVSRYVAILVTGACLPPRQEERKALDDLLILLRRVSRNLLGVNNNLLQVGSNLERVRRFGSAETVEEGGVAVQEIRATVQEICDVTKEASEVMRLIFQKITC
jgi:hypothetical protein